MTSQLHSVVLVDAVRTPFGKAGSMYSGTRADDLMVRAMRDFESFSTMGLKATSLDVRFNGHFIKRRQDVV